MLDLNAWLGDEKYFEILKVVSDKGLFALIIALSGGFISILLERYKSILKRQEEVSKLISPGIVELMTQSEVLFQTGNNVLDLLDDCLVRFLEWVDALYESRPEYTTKIMPCFPKGPEFLERSVTCVDGGNVTIRELLKKTAGDASIIEVLDRMDFASTKAHFS
jgi:hypothetical protein